MKETMTKNLRQSFKSLLGFEELVSFLEFYRFWLYHISIFITTSFFFFGIILLQQVPILVLDILVSNREDESQLPILYDHQPLQLSDDDYKRVCNIRKTKVQSI